MVELPYGHDAEIATIGRAIEMFLHLGKPTVLIIEGPSRTGKSFLVAHAVNRIEGAHTVRHVPVDEYQCHPFAGLSELFMSLITQRDAAEALSGPPKWTRDLITNVVLIGVFYFFVKFIRYALWSWAPFLLETQYNLKGDAAGYLSTVFDVGGAFGVVLIGWLSDRFFGSKRTPVAFLFILLMVASCLLLYTAGTTSLTWFGISIGLIGFSLYGPDALMSGAAAIDVGDRRTATMAAGIINGMGSVGSVVQELVLGEVLKGKDAVGATFGVLLASSVLAAMCLGVLVARTRAGHGHV